jgi:hypothetical protein
MKLSSVPGAEVPVGPESPLEMINSSAEMSDLPLLDASRSRPSDELTE